MVWHVRERDLHTNRVRKIYLNIGVFTNDEYICNESGTIRNRHVFRKMATIDIETCYEQFETNFMNTNRVHRTKEKKDIQRCCRNITSYDLKFLEDVVILLSYE